MSLNTKENWTLKEKKKLARLLSTYPLDAYENIASYLPDRSQDEVRDYIKKMIHSTKSFLTLNKEKTAVAELVKAPLETWLEVASSLVEMEQFDYSSCLSKVMGFISSFEEFPEGDIEGHPLPDYRMIYKYISQILEGNRREDIDELGPLESAIVIDLIHSLMEVLSEADLTVHFNVIRWKYILLRERDHAGHPIPELLRQAAENDFGEFIKSNEKVDFLEELTQTVDDDECSANPHQLHIDPLQQDNCVVDNPLQQDNCEVNNPLQQDNCEANISVNEDNDPEHNEEQNKIVARYTYEASYSTDATPKKTNPHSYLNSAVFHNKPGRKPNDKEKDKTKIVTEIVRVVPPKNAIIVNKAPRNKRRTLRHDGKYFGINVSESVSEKIEKSAPKKEKKDLDIPDDSRKADIHTAWQSRKRKYESLKKKKDGKKEMKKDKWYSLNPFCLPISLLDLDS